MYKLYILPLFCLLCLSSMGQNRLWQPMPFHLNSGPRFFFEDTVNDEFIIMGEFWRVDDSTCKSIIKYDGQSYTRPFLDRRFISTPVTAFRYQDYLCYGGYPGVACETDSQFFWLDSLNAIALGAIPYQGKMLIHDQFDSFAGQAIGGCVIWDGQGLQDLHRLDTAIDAERNQVMAMAVYQDQIYVGGNLNLPLKEIIRWDGNKWTDVGGGIPSGTFGWVWDMVEYKGSLYVGGAFSKVEGAPGNNIARWDGNQWHEVGGGVGTNRPGKEAVIDMMVYEDELWIVGDFENVGDIPTQAIAKWDGERWCGFNQDIEATFIQLGVFRDTFYVGGIIHDYYGDSTRIYMAKFLDRSSPDSCSSPLISSEIPLHPKISYLYPNPGDTYVYLEVPTYQEAEPKLYDLKGKVIHVPIQALDNTYKIDISNLPKGIYLIRWGEEMKKLWVK